MDISQTAPAKEPLTLPEAKEHLQIEHEADDAYIRTLIVAAREAVERDLGRAFITRTITLDLDIEEAGSPIVLPYAPFGSLTSFVSYDSAGASTALVADTDYFTTGTDPARIVAINGWAPGRAFKAVRIVYTAGYGASGESVPEALLYLVKETVRQFWESPERFRDAVRSAYRRLV